MLRDAIKTFADEVRKESARHLVTVIIETLDSKGFDLVDILEGMIHYISKFRKSDRYSEAMVYLEKAIEVLMPD